MTRRRGWSALGCSPAQVARERGPSPSRRAKPGPHPGAPACQGRGSAARCALPRRGQRPRCPPAAPPRGRDSGRREDHGRRSPRAPPPAHRAPGARARAAGTSWPAASRGGLRGSRAPGRGAVRPSAGWLAVPGFSVFCFWGFICVWFLPVNLYSQTRLFKAGFLKSTDRRVEVARSEACLLSALAVNVEIASLRL